MTSSDIIVKKKKLTEKDPTLISLKIDSISQEDSLPFDRHKIVESLMSDLDMSEEDAEKLEKQLRKNELDLDDYLAQIRQVKKMGSFSSILKMIPGMANIKDLKVDEKEFTRIEAIICSMTDKERKNPKLLNGSRRIRIANGSGTSVQEINNILI